MVVGRPRSNSRIAAEVAASAALLAGCGSAAPARSTPPSTVKARAVSASVPPPRRRVTVSIRNYGFHPEHITVKTGAKVTFTNHDAMAHTATSDHHGFDVVVEPGASQTVTVSKLGTYAYYCEFHEFMRGTVTVVR